MLSRSVACISRRCFGAARACSSVSDAVLYHNPKCSKSRMAKQLLDDAGASYSTREYLVDPLSVEELRGLRAALAKPVLDWTRTGEASFDESSLTRGSNEDDILAAMVEAPILMERPIFALSNADGDRVAVVGRPPQNVINLLEDVEADLLLARLTGEKANPS